jgi:hypothetical protein
MVERIPQAFLLKDAVQSLFKRLYVPVKQVARLHFLYEVLKGEQSQHLAWLEP